jgi:membrane peptidoglycan carboxypeptidase
VPASALSAEQSALLAGSLINPRRYSPGEPPRRLLARQRIILRRMRATGGTQTAMPSRLPSVPAEPAEDPAAELDTLDEEDPEAQPDETEEIPPDSAVPPAPTQDPP